MTGIVNMTDLTVKFARVEVNTEKESFNLGAEEFLIKAKKKLLRKKDLIQETKIAKANKEKTVLTETLKIFPKSKLTALNTRRDIVPWLSRYQSVKKTLQEANIPDWKNQLLLMGKESLKLEADKTAVKYFDSLGELERYINSTYVSGLSLIDDLLSEVLKKDTPKTIAQSIQNIQDILTVLKTIKKKKLGPKFTDRQYEMLIQKALMKKDQSEYRRDHAKSRSALALTSSTVLHGSDDTDDDDEVNFDETLAEVVETTSLDSKRTFLTQFLKQKLIQLKELENSQRILGEETENKKTKHSKFYHKKVKFGDKAFILTQADSEDDLSSFEDIDENVYASFEKQKPSNNKPKKDDNKKLSKKPCPIKCSKKYHANGS